MAGFELSDANYKTVVDILKGRFGQRQTILDSHIDTLTTMNRLAKNTDIAGWFNLHNAGCIMQVAGHVLWPTILDKSR